ncbi:hypothetical protein J7E97_07840 [Streptomyces sp. ISL-66]|uniref:hypothetical protein n=1 Tax=Streptomyces sp. ISL-66 TaxID=2819186 RepID=UPI001BE8EE21|nr:hypothetical protein [Streptomyces sp. ISL-66]MBT2467784.1 hypothetical protein [Streptomyces sp. ISL-66]
MSARNDILHGLRAAENGSVSDETPEEQLDAYRAEVLAEAEARLVEVYRFAPLAERADGINFAIGLLMSLRGESRG